MIDLATGKVYSCAKEPNKAFGQDSRSYNWVRGLINSHGAASETYFFVYLDQYESNKHYYDDLNQQRIEKYAKRNQQREKLRTQKRYPGRKVINIVTGKVCDSGTLASIDFGKCAGWCQACITNDRSNDQWKFMYYDEYLKLNKEEH